MNKIECKKLVEYLSCCDENKTIDYNGQTFLDAQHLFCLCDKCPPILPGKKFRTRRCSIYELMKDQPDDPNQHWVIVAGEKFMYRKPLALLLTHLKSFYES